MEIFKKRKREKIVIPKSVQDTIPVQTAFDDGIFKVGDRAYSRTYMFSDINYSVASVEDKLSMLGHYAALLNSLDENASIKITVNNRRLNKSDFKRDVLIEEKGDYLDEYRKEYNKVLMDKASGNASIVQEKYFTITVEAENYEEAKQTFRRIGSNLTVNLSKLGSRCLELDAVQRLQILHDFYRTGEEVYFNFDMDECRKKGHSFKDYICPDHMEVKSEYMMLGDRYARALFLKEYSSFITDDFLSMLTDRNQNMMVTIDIKPVSIAKAVKEVERRLLGMETNITNWQRKQNENHNFSAEVPYDMEQKRYQLRQVLNDLMTNDQRMALCCISIVHTADSMKTLQRTTQDIQAIAREKLCQIGVLKHQQLDGLNTALPVGVKKLEISRTMLTDTLKAFVPFSVQEVQHNHGIYYGLNVKSGNLITVDRRKLLNGNSFILGVSGSGKSFTAKNEITPLLLSTDADIIIIDPEAEYGQLVKSLGGEVIKISANSPCHINAMDMNREYGETNPIIEKSQFLQSLCEQIIAGNSFTKGQQSIIDRCTESVYRYYLQGNYMGVPPTLVDFRDELLKQPEPEAKSLALELELFTKGSLNTFAKQTNVDTSNRLICYDIIDLGEQLRAIGMLVILDSILNRITKNRAEGRQTFIFIDEIYLLFMHEYSAQFLFKLWKRVRKYGAFCTGITQDVEDLLQSHTARTMLANSEFIVMLNQAATNREDLAKLLNISDNQLSFITNVDAGNGLIKVGSTLVPFDNSFPKNNKLYKLMTTKPGE